MSKYCQYKNEGVFELVKYAESRTVPKNKRIRRRSHCTHTTTHERCETETESRTESIYYESRI